jgi:Methyltransferase domain
MSTADVRVYVPPGHFYSPIVNPADLRGIVLADSQIESSQVPAVEIDLGAMLELWNSSRSLLRECSFPDEPAAGRRYYFKNDFYSFGDAISLYLIIRNFQPRRVIEIGSGFSSACMLDTVEVHNMSPVAFTFIEPFADRLKGLLRATDRTTSVIIEQPVQQVDLKIFDDLRENDILFVDSAHVVKTGSDVNHIFFNILPRLKAGVLIHFHDIFFPFEYGSNWVVKENRSWNETYLLKAFLMYNSAFKIEFFNDCFRRFHRGAIEASCPKFLSNTGGAIWLRKRTGAWQQTSQSSQHFTNGH